MTEVNGVKKLGFFAILGLCGLFSTILGLNINYAIANKNTNEADHTIIRAEIVERYERTHSKLSTIETHLAVQTAILKRLDE